MPIISANDRKNDDVHGETPGVLRVRKPSIRRPPRRSIVFGERVMPTLCPSYFSRGGATVLQIGVFGPGIVASPKEISCFIDAPLFKPWDCNSCDRGSRSEPGKI